MLDTTCQCPRLASSQILSIFSISLSKIRKKSFTVPIFHWNPCYHSSFWLFFCVRKSCELYKIENVAFCVKVCKKFIVLCWGEKMFFLKILDLECLHRNLMFRKWPIDWPSKVHLYLWLMENWHLLSAENKHWSSHTQNTFKVLF